VWEIFNYAMTIVIVLSLLQFVFFEKPTIEPYNKTNSKPKKNNKHIVIYFASNIFYKIMI